MATGPHLILKTHPLREEPGKSQESPVLEPHPLWYCEHARDEGVGDRGQEWSFRYLGFLDEEIKTHPKSQC